jgi:hypothetical protein
MQVSNNRRENILSTIRKNLLKQKVEHPHIPAFRRPVGSLKAVFEAHLKEAGGSAWSSRTTRCWDKKPKPSTTKSSCVSQMALLAATTNRAIVATLVHGAQRAPSLNVFFLLLEATS